jgi:hypothetical protein
MKCREFVGVIVYMWVQGFKSERPFANVRDVVPRLGSIDCVLVGSIAW